MVYFYGGFSVIIYCDLKFCNFIIDEFNEFKVGDFGLSKFIKVKNVYEVFKLMGEIGSYWYMVLEVFLYESYNIKVDVFFFVMILYEMFEGVVFFVSEDVYMVVKMVVEENKWFEFGFKMYYLDGMWELIIRCWIEFVVKWFEFDFIVEEF